MTVTRTRFLTGIAALAAVATVAPAYAAEDDATCYTDAVVRLSQGLTDEPSDLRFHTVEGTSRCTGTIGGKALSVDEGPFTATGSAQSTSCAGGTGSFVGQVKLRAADGSAVHVPLRVSFTRTAFAGQASGEVVDSGAKVTGAFATQPLDGDCRNDPVEHVRIRVVAHIGG